MYNWKGHIWGTPFLSSTRARKHEKNIKGRSMSRFFFFFTLFHFCHIKRWRNKVKNTFIYTYIYTFIYTYIYTFTYTYICPCIYTFIYTYMYIYIYTYTHLLYFANVLCGELAQTRHIQNEEI